MSKGKGNSSSPVLFWGLLVLILLALAGTSMVFLGLAPWWEIRGLQHVNPDVGLRAVFWPNMMLGVLRPFTFFLIYVAVVAALVYRDASKRGMDPWLWAAIAAFVPFFIGIVIYLVVRANGHAVCANCGKTIRSEYKVCPYCGKSRELLCSGCGRPVSPDWKVCPYCGVSLVPGQGPQAAGV
jgi:RNA polymerase subunit RPABC4/transcription elongation factor Spt4